MTISKCFSKMFILSLILCLSLTQFVSATQTLENESVMGTLLDGYINNMQNLPIDDQLRQLQEINGESFVVQIGQKRMLIESQKAWIQNKASILWGMIGGLFIIMFELLKGAFYFLEIYIFVYVIMVMFPRVLINIRNGVFKWYAKKEVN